jgi:hypothetical protein
MDSLVGAAESTKEVEVDIQAGWCCLLRQFTILIA